MSKERKAVVVVDANVKPFERGLRDAEGLMKGFEQKAAKSGGYGHGARGRGNTVGGVFSGAVGGGAAGTARAFFGGWMAAEGMEAAINALTIGIRKHQLAQARATGDLDKMALATIKVNQAQEQFVSSFPVLGASIARLMRAIGSTEKLQEIMQIRAGQRSIYESQRAKVESLTDAIEVLEASLKGASKSEVESIRLRQELSKAEKEHLDILEEQNKIIKNNKSLVERYKGRRGELEFEIDVLRKRYKETFGNEFDESDTLMTLNATGKRILSLTKEISDLDVMGKQRESLVVEASETIAESESRITKERHEKGLRLESIEHEKIIRIVDFVRDKQYEILQVQLNNELANQEDAEGIFNGKLKLLELEEKYVMDKMQREKASYGEQRIVSRLFRQREESLYGEKERALAKEREEEDRKRRDLQKRLNAPDNATTAAYVSMSGAVTNASAEQQTAKNTQELVKETRMTNRELRRLTQAQQAAHFGKQAVGFRRERLN